MIEMPLVPATHQFKETHRSVTIKKKTDEFWISRFHPMKSILACAGSSQVILFKAKKGSLPFSHWKEKQAKFGPSLNKRITALEWNLSGTQLAAGCEDGDLIVWIYPSADVVFQVNRHLNQVCEIKWNPFEHDVFSTLESGQSKLLIWHSYTRLHSNSNLFGEIRESNKECNRKIKWIPSSEYKRIAQVEWIAKRKIALGFSNGLIEISEIDECDSIRVIKQFKHDDGITSLIWNKRTEYLASCSHDKSIKIWSLDMNEPLYSQELASICYKLVWRSKGKTVDEIVATRKLHDNFNFLCGLKDGTVVMWNPLDDFKIKKKLVVGGPLTGLCFSSNEQFLSSADHNHLIIWSTETWTPVFTCQCNLIPGIQQGFSCFSTDSIKESICKLVVNSTTDEIQVIEYN